MPSRRHPRSRMLIATDELAIDAVLRAQDVLARHGTDHLAVCIYSDVPGDDAGGFEGSVETPEEIERDWAQLQANAHAALEQTAAALATKGSIERRVELGDPGATSVQWPSGRGPRSSWSNRIGEGCWDASCISAP